MDSRECAVIDANQAGIAAAKRAGLCVVPIGFAEETTAASGFQSIDAWAANGDQTRAGTPRLVS
jgi:beta-phosphoglucomutase-like phosphatase (HAD superfamily)